MPAAQRPGSTATRDMTELPYRRALVVANPISGRGQGTRAAEELAAGLRRWGTPTDVFFTGARGDAFTHLRTLAEPVDLVVAVGGDGTVREVLDGLVDPATPVGVLPLGTANVLATELGLPRDVHHALEILERARPRPVDVATVNGRLSLLMTGVGIDALAVREVERRRHGPITKLTYVGAVLRALRGYRAPRLTVSLDDEGEPHRAGFVIVANTVNYGGTIRLASDARMDDGLLEVYLFPTGRVLQLAAAFVRGLLGHLPGGAVQVRRARSVRISSEEPVPYQVDGDLGGETPVEIDVAPNRYHLVAP
jgi:YegS/Rv2252/BmrU family lipid kinase